MSNEETNAFDLVNLYLKHIGLLMSLLIFQLHGALFKCTRSIGMCELACNMQPQSSIVCQDKAKFTGNTHYHSDKIWVFW